MTPFAHTSRRDTTTFFSEGERRLMFCEIDAGLSPEAAISRQNLVDDWRRCWLIRVAEVKGSLGRTFVPRPKTLPLHSGEAKRVTPGSPRAPSSMDGLLVPDTGKDKNVFEEGFSNRRLLRRWCARPLIASATGPTHSWNVPHVRNERQDRDVPNVFLCCA